VKSVSCGDAVSCSECESRSPTGGPTCCNHHNSLDPLP
jgi:hypothetical protein